MEIKKKFFVDLNSNFFQVDPIIPSPKSAHISILAISSMAL